MITLEEAIAHEKAKADKARESEALFLHDDLMWNAKESHRRIEEHEQYADWLEELSRRRVEELFRKTNGKAIRDKAIDDFQEWIKTQIVGLDNTAKKILVAVDDRWESATDKFKEREKMKWELISQDSRYVMYRKGDRHDNTCVEFDLELKHIYITESMFIRNDTPMLETQNEWIAHSAKYGYTQQICPTLGMDDLEFINKKAKELFTKECD